MKIRSLLLAPMAGLLALAGSAAAQSFNCDVDSAFGTPVSTFAAAGLAGTWNNVPAAAGSTALLDITGAATAVTMQRTVGTGGAFSFNNAGTTGDDQALMDDAQDPSPSGTWTITGLAAGNYTVYTYGWAPDSSTYRTGVSINGGPVTSVGGVWPAAYVVGVTHAVDNVSIPAAGTITIVLTTVTSFATFNGVQVRKLPDPAIVIPSCFGDGTGATCPCGNNGLLGNGCANSFVPSGANLSAAGIASISTDTMTLSGSGMPPTSSVLYFQATSNTPPGVVAGDGLNCLGGNVVRLGTKQNAGGASSYPGAGDPKISIKGMNAAGSLRHYAARYRDHTVLFCTPDTFNQTNAVSWTWVP
jgi:hypothetical protein